MVGILLSYWEGLFSGAMLVSGSVWLINEVADLSPKNIFGNNNATDGYRLGSKIGFDQGLAAA